MKLQISILTLTLTLAGRPLARSQTIELKVGDSAPPLAFETLLQAPDGTQATWPSLNGKVVVLEFWATWCIPCIRAMPHLNQLADTFRNSPVEFIAITDEAQQTVAPFLKRQPIHAWIGLNTDKTMFNRYGVAGIPHTVVVDRTGNIAAITRPSELTEQHLKDLLAGKKLTLPYLPSQNSFSFRPGELPGSTSKDQQAVFQVMIRPSESLNRGSGGGGGKFTFIGSSVREMLCAAFGVNAIRVTTKTDLPEGRFDAVVNVPVNEGDDGRNWLRQAVEASFHLRGRRETREMEAIIIAVTNPNAKHLSVTASAGNSSSQSDASSGRMQSMNMPISSLLGSLEDLLKKPVLNETGLTNRYDWTLQWEAKNADRLDTDGLLKAIREQLGLGIVTAKRSVEVIVVDKTN